MYASVNCVTIAPNNGLLHVRHQDITYTYKHYLSERGTKLTSFRKWTGNVHDDVIKWKYFPRYWPFVQGFTGDRWSPRTKASDAELWCFLWPAPWINGWVNNREAGDLRRHRAHCDVIVMLSAERRSFCPGLTVLNNVDIACNREIVITVLNHNR